MKGDTECGPCIPVVVEVFIHSRPKDWCSVADPKLLIPDQDPTRQVIKNPDPTFQVVSNQILFISSYRSFENPAQFSKLFEFLVFKGKMYKQSSLWGKIIY